MNAKSLGAALLLCAWACSAAGAQTPSYGRVPPADVTAATSGPVSSAAIIQPPGTSRWLSAEPCLCNSDNTSPPIGGELYLHSGVAIPFGSQTLGDECRTAFVIAGGVRTLFFNQALDAAWVVDTGISSIQNSHRRDRRFNLKVIDFTGDLDITGQPEVALIQFGTALRPGLFLRSTHRTFVNLGIGREWYIHFPADADVCKWRFGIDGGGRYGTLSQEYDRIRHRTDVIGGAYVAAHHHLEIPTGWGFFLIGGRAEYSYTWSDILQQASDIQEANVLFSIGLRF